MGACVTTAGPSPHCQPGCGWWSCHCLCVHRCQRCQGLGTKSQRQQGGTFNPYEWNGCGEEWRRQWTDTFSNIPKARVGWLCIIASGCRAQIKAFEFLCGSSSRGNIPNSPEDTEDEDDMKSTDSNSLRLQSTGFRRGRCLRNTGALFCLCISLLLLLYV